MSKMDFIANSLRRLDSMFPGYFPTFKHNHYADFGYPTELTYSQLMGMFKRNGLARAAIEKTILKTWQDTPLVLEFERDGQSAKAEETKFESDLRKHFQKLRLWQRVADADRRSLVGNYAGLILRLADNQQFEQPVNQVPGGLDGLVEIIPASQGQLTVAEWDTDPSSPNYGEPKMFSFNEAVVGNASSHARAFNLHPDRVVVWSIDGTIHGTPLLEAGYNDLLTIEKVVGAGGEGFWKNAKSSPVLEVDKDAKIADMAKAMGVEVNEVADKMNEQVEDFQKGFDHLLMLQGMKAETLNVSLPSPEHFFSIALNVFAASIQMPVKILVGMQTGERASTEDAKEWNQTIMARRQATVIPNLMNLIDRLERFGILPEKEWHVDWTDLTESSMAEKVERADNMASTNQKMKESGEIVFTHEEIRSVVGLEPLSENESSLDEDQDDEAAVTPKT